jgi:signal transduction histidine kinase
MANELLTSEIEEREAVERESDAKDEFLAMLSHELRNPLSAIASASSLLGLPSIPFETLERARQVIQRQAKFLSMTVDDVLELSRAMSGKIALARRTIDLSDVVRTSVDQLTAIGRTAHHDIDIDLSTCLIDGDVRRLEQMVSNLIDNALKFTPPGGRIAISLKSIGTEAHLTVKDNGAGMPPELLARVFDVFVQGARPLDRSQGGLGIGLSLVRCLAELHGGSVDAQSEGSGNGCTFTLRLPALPCDAPV